MKPSLAHLAVAALGGMTVSGCASHHTSSETAPEALAALRADVRIVRGETTWVTRGKGNELVGRTRADLVTVQPMLDRAAAFLVQIYPRDSVAPIVAAVRRAPAPDKPFIAAAPVPVDSRGVPVEIVLVDPKTLEEQRKKHEGQPLLLDMGMLGSGPVTPAVRAWLSARASQLTNAPAKSNQAHGEVDDSRVPAWAVDMASVAGNEEMIDVSTKSLAAHPETIIPLSKYFTMERPAPTELAGGRRGSSPSGGSGGEGRPGGMAGGRNGMGGGRGRMGGGRGGMGGSRGGSPGGTAERTFPLQGLALFHAQSAVLGKYFARTGYAAAGDLIDAQITGKPVDDVFDKRNLGSLPQVDADWRGWLLERADMLNRR